MFWADRIAQEIEARFGRSRKLFVRDEKTISGRVHVGSMRGVAIHGAVAEALAARGVEAEFAYELNDFDVFDSVPGYLPQEQFSPYLGMLLKDVPSPEPGFESFAHYYGAEFRKVIETTGFTPRFYWGSEVYLSGRMDGVIREALEHPQEIRRIYKEVSGGERAETWLPISVVCPQCRKVATTQATDFDGETVAVVCITPKGGYAQGCGFEGRVSPFGGNAKLPWKPEWAAKWKVMAVDVEGGGKDHSTKGGSRDVANHIAREVFHYEPPCDIPYEFFLVGGKKMSSSKGRGSSSHEIAELMPPKIFRLALFSKDINQAFNFDPEGDTLPVLFDLYDKLATSCWEGAQDDYARLFAMVHPGGEAPEPHFLPRFSQVAFLAQMPHLSFFEEVERLKGYPLTDADRDEAQERREYAGRWLRDYAPEKFVFELKTTLPDEVQALSGVQKGALREILHVLRQEEVLPDGETLHEMLHTIKTTHTIPPGDFFSAIYLAFFGKPQGPKAGWFLSGLQRDFVLERLSEASQ